MSIRMTVASVWKQREVVPASNWRAIQTAVLDGWKQFASSRWLAVRTPVVSVRKRCALVASSSWLAVPICMILSVVVVCWSYFNENSSGGGEPFAWFDGPGIFSDRITVVLAPEKTLWALAHCKKKS